MRKLLTTCLCSLFVSISLFAQDIIVTNDARKIEAKILEVSKTEIKYKDNNDLNGPTFILETKEISSIIFSNGQIKTYNASSHADNSADNEAAPSFIIRSGNTYYYNGRSMRGKDYSSFLSTNCPTAYTQYSKGHNISIAGWVLFGIGVGLDVGFSWWAPYTWIPALGFEIASIPTLIVGYSKMHKSADVFNSTCSAKKPAAYWSINASQNGIGIAYNF